MARSGRPDQRALTNKPQETTMLIERQWHAYNDRRFSRPWAARITFEGVDPIYQFIGRFASSVLTFDAEPGEIVVTGQKDMRGNKTSKDFYLVQPSGKLSEISEHEALLFWRTKDGAAKANAEPAQELMVELVAELVKVRDWMQQLMRGSALDETQERYESVCAILARAKGGQP
jgi:hypothetical protein